MSGVSKVSKVRKLLKKRTWRNKLKAQNKKMFEKAVYGMIEKEVEDNTFHFNKYPRFRANRRVIDYVLENMPEQIQFVDEKIKKNNQRIFEYVDDCYSIYDYLDEEQKKAVLLMYAPDVSKEVSLHEKETWIELIKENHICFKFMDEKLKKDEDFMLKVACLRIGWIQLGDLAENSKFMLKLISTDINHCTSIGESLIKNCAFQFECVEINPDTIKWIIARNCTYDVQNHKYCCDPSTPFLCVFWRAIKKFKPGKERWDFFTTVLTGGKFTEATQKVRSTTNFKHRKQLDGIYDLDKKALEKYVDVTITFSK